MQLCLYSRACLFGAPVYLPEPSNERNKGNKGTVCSEVPTVIARDGAQAEGNQSDVGRERCIKELQYIVYTIFLLMNEQRPHPYIKVTTKVSYTEPRAKRGQEDKKRSATAGNRTPNLHLRARFRPAEPPLSNRGDRTPMPEGTSVML
jgi:hypothetical protein